MKTKLSANLVRQLNKNNKGASLVTVLLITSIVAIFVTAVLAIVILNVYMRKADFEGQNNFYDAESAMEEIRAGLATDVSEATSTAYVETLKHYQELPDEAAKVAYFNKRFLEELRNSTDSTPGGEKLPLVVDGHYNVEKLQGYLKETKDNAVVGLPKEESGSTDDQEYIDSNDSRYNETRQGAVLKNVRVKYTDPDTEFVSAIKADIVLEYPTVDFQNAGSADNVFTYSIIANDTFSAESNVKIVGNAYIGGKQGGSEEDAEGAANISAAKGVVFEKAEDSDETSVICGGEFKIGNASSVDANGVTIWADSLRLNRSKFNLNNGSAYIRNDIDLQNGGESTMSGKLIMFGNYGATPLTNMFAVPHVQEDFAKNIADYSSSILISGIGTKLDLSGLNTMIIGGSAYIDTESNTASSKNGGAWDNENIVSGQSMMMKPDQRAYFVPATLVGAQLDKNGNNYTHGLSNPMTNSQFNSLKEDIQKDKGYENVSDVPLSDLVNMTLTEDTLETSIYGFYKDQFDGTLSGSDGTTIPVSSFIADIDLASFDRLVSDDIKNGHFSENDSESTYYNALNVYKAGHDNYAANPTQNVSDLPAFLRYEYIACRPTVSVNAYQTTVSSKPVVYLFLKFSTIGSPTSGIQGVTYKPKEEFYNAWYRKYNENVTNKTKLLSNLSYYSPGGIKLPSSAETDNTRMYFTGNVLATDKADFIVHDWLTKGLTMELALSYYKQSAEYQDEYFTMKRNLSKKFESLSETEKNQNPPDLFGNIIQTQAERNGKTYSISQHGDRADYVSDSGKTAIVTTKDEFAYNNTVKNSLKEKGQEANVIICTGDVTLDTDFEGMVIAGGDVKVSAGTTVTANSSKAKEALMASWDDTDKSDCAANFVIYASRYLLGGASGDDESEDESEDEDNLSMKKFVTYRNWTRE
ncbi:MAG: pilus assembly PilX N-terminal domain-containing protein [Lachnospiraceae bacterium]|nr:pilus assembly PilX N-terminal domain-containing protein [Lachnospiraceae bacterium]